MCSTINEMEMQSRVRTMVTMEQLASTRVRRLQTFASQVISSGTKKLMSPAPRLAYWLPVWLNPADLKINVE